MRRRLPIILGFAVSFFIAVKPVAAHAGIFSLTGIAFDAVLDMILSFMNLVVSLLAKLQLVFNFGLNWVLAQKIATNMPIIGVTWTIIRNMCNLVFLVLFIGIAFATIFNTLSPFKNWHYSSALMPLLIAALLMNFSLAIGKTVVLASNEASGVLIKVNSDPGGELIKLLRPSNLAVEGISQGTPSDSPEYTKALSKRYADCYKEEANPPTFFESGGILDAGPAFYRNVVNKTFANCVAEITANRVGGVVSQVHTAITTVPTGTTQQKIGYIIDAIFKIVMLLMLCMCLGSAAIFLGIRILAVWVLLVLSPIAFITYAIPGKKDDKEGFWQQWVKYMLAWNVFGPLYLLSLIPGLAMLSASGEMLTGLGVSASVLGATGIIFQQFFFYAFAVLIFVGGLGLSLKSSFALNVASTPYIGGLATRLGVFQSGGSKLGQIAKVTGAKGGYETVKATAVARGEKIQQQFRPISQRFTTPTYADKLASMRQRMGIAGGAQEVASLTAANVKKEQDALNQRSWNMDREQKVVFMRKHMNSINVSEKLAAREILMGMGQLDQGEIDATEAMYPAGIPQREFKKRSKRAGTEERSKGYNEDLDKLNLKAMNLATRNGLVAPILAAIPDAGAKKEFLKVLAQRDPENAAVLGVGILTRAEAYNAVVTNPERLMELPDSYHALGPETDAIRDQLIGIFPDPGPNPANAKEQLQLERRERFKESLINKGGGPKIPFINAIMP